MSEVPFIFLPGLPVSKIRFKKIWLWPGLLGVRRRSGCGVSPAPAAGFFNRGRGTSVNETLERLLCGWCPHHAPMGFILEVSIGWFIGWLTYNDKNKRG
jgi:hypothetical protein